MNGRAEYLRGSIRLLGNDPVGSTQVPLSYVMLWSTPLHCCIYTRTHAILLDTVELTVAHHEEWSVDYVPGYMVAAIGNETVVLTRC